MINDNTKQEMLDRIDEQHIVEAEKSPAMRDAIERHPQTANLTPFDSERAREANRKGLEKRLANAKIRAENKEIRQELLELTKSDVDLTNTVNIDSVLVLKHLMVRALQNEDLDTAADLASKIAEYERPKLARQETLSVNVNLENVPDDIINMYVDGKITEEELYKHAKE